VAPRGCAHPDYRRGDRTRDPRHGGASRQSVAGAISVHFLIGLLFTFVYGGVATPTSDPFFTQGTQGAVALRLWFSGLTLATVGYGDYTPSDNLEHTPAIVPALLGQVWPGTTRKP
jgi:hypothetical protein